MTILETAAGRRRTTSTGERGAARDAQTRAADELKRRGWRVKLVVTTGEPLRDLLSTAAGARAHMVAIGARGVSGVRQLLLGSVAEGVLNRCPTTVLVVR